MPGRNYTSSNYRYGFNGKENDNEVKGPGNSIDYGARIYDPRLGRWLSIDPLMSKYPNLSPYNFGENNPIFFNDPTGRDAIGKIEGNTITISALIYIVNTGDNKINIAEAQKSINQYWGKDFQYTDESGKQYNVKFDITVKEVSPVKGGNPIDEGSNLVRPQNKDFRSNVNNRWYGKWAVGQKDQTYAHEIGHMLGLADQYVDVENNANNLDQGGNDGKTQCWDYKSTSPDEIMGKASSGKPQVTQKDINGIAKFILKNQKDGKAVINQENLTKSKQATGFAAPTVDDRVEMEQRATSNFKEVVEPHREKK